MFPILSHANWNQALPLETGFPCTSLKWGLVFSLFLHSTRPVAVMTELLAFDHCSSLFFLPTFLKTTSFEFPIIYYTTHQSVQLQSSTDPGCWSSFLQGFSTWLIITLWCYYYLNSWWFQLKILSNPILSVADPAISKDLIHPTNTSVFPGSSLLCSKSSKPKSVSKLPLCPHFSP